MIVYYLFAMVWAHLVLANSKLDAKLCGESNVLPYTGFRIYRQFQLRWPARHSYLFLHCSYGKVDYRQYFVTLRNQNFNWNETLCFTPDKCYRAVRRKRYAQRLLPVYITNIQIGGLYKCNEETCLDRVTPVLPLLAASPAEAFTEWHYFKPTKYVPVAYTPDITSLQYPRRVRMDGIPRWSRHLKIDENYVYTRRDRIKPWYLANKLANKAHELLSINERYIPWEFDYTAHQLAKPPSKLVALEDRIKG